MSRFAFVTLALCAVLPAVAGGCGTPSFLVTPVSSSSRLDEVEVERARGSAQGKVAIIEVEGMLMNARTGGFLQATENKLSLFTQEMNRAAADKAVKAVVLRVNSPGGTVTTSDTMYEIVRDFRKRTGKPVVASTQEVAASGAYYVSCAADKIVASPTGVVGSIGVIFNTLEFEGTLAKLGARADAIKSGPLKDMGSPFKSLGDPERAVMQEMVDEYFGRFVQVVHGNRPVKEGVPTLPLAADYAGVYSGRVFSGARAAELGLVDATGRLDDALDLARQMAKVPGAKAVMYRRPYGYSGSIYATSPTPQPRADGLRLELPPSRLTLPGGFYYLWEPGL
jgi:protease-4